MRKIHFRSVTGGLLAILVAPAALWGQEQDTARAAQDTIVPVYNLERIEVTVTRIRSQVNRAPYAIHVVDERAIQAAEMTVGLEESLAEVAGVWVNNRHNFALGSRISIRGFGSRAQFGVRGVKLLLDGIPLTLPDGQSQLNNIDLATIGRVEVIRGPASSLYGNAAGGVISFSTEQPPAAVAAPELNVLWGSHGDGRNFQKYAAKLGGRQGDFDYVASLSHFRTDGFRQHSESQTTVVNTRARWLLDGATRLTAIVNAANTPVAQNPGSLPFALAETSPDTAWPFNVAQRTGESARQIQGGLALQRRLSASHELRVSAWGLTRKLDNPIPPRIILVDRGGGGARAELEFTPVGSPVTAIIGGLEMEIQSDDRLEFENNGGSRGDTTLNQDEQVRGLGAFVQGVVELSERWALTLGARYDNVRFKVEDDFFDDGDNSGSRTMDAFSPMVGVRHTARPWLNVYANVTRSFETPTTTELKNSPTTTGGFNQILEPQKAWGAEIGFKGTVAERFDYSLANYCAWVSDELIPFEDPAVPGRSFFRNAGESRHCGIEAQAGWLVADGLTLSANYTFSDFQFTDYVVEGDTLDGNRLPGVPIHQAHGRLSYRSPVNVFGSLEVTYSDAYFTDDENSTRDEGGRNPSYTVFDLRLGYDGELGAWSFRPFLGVNNLFDTRYNSSVTINAFGAPGQRRFYEPAPGRTFYAGLGVPVQLGR